MPSTGEGGPQLPPKPAAYPPDPPKADTALEIAGRDEVGDEGPAAEAQPPTESVSCAEDADMDWTLVDRDEAVGWHKRRED